MLCCLIHFSKYKSVSLAALKRSEHDTCIPSTSICLCASVGLSASNSRVTRTFFRFPSRVRVIRSRLFLEMFSLIHIKYSDFGKFVLELLYQNGHSHIALAHAHRLSSSRGAARSLHMISTPWSSFVYSPLLTGGNFAWIGAGTSVFTLVAVATERYFAALHPFDKKGKFSARRIKVCSSLLYWFACTTLKANELFLLELA